MYVIFVNHIYRSLSANVTESQSEPHPSRVHTAIRHAKYPPPPIKRVKRTTKQRPSSRVHMHASRHTTCACLYIISTLITKCYQQTGGFIRLLSKFYWTLLMLKGVSVLYAWEQITEQVSIKDTCFVKYFGLFLTQIYFDYVFWTLVPGEYIINGHWNNKKRQGFRRFTEKKERVIIEAFAALGVVQD